MFSTYISVLFVALIYVAISEAVDQYKTVSTNDGDVRGIQNTTILAGISFYSFRGIPYAQPPINDLRFKAPVPIASWKPAVKDALEYSSICPYLYPNLGARESNEDCLTLNIFVPDVKPNEKLAVMFFIHGGGFGSGSGDGFFYGPDFIVEKQTILVTINYRLGALGFLSLDLPQYSGNMGLKDQQLALKWIHSNIQHFGGDNNRITIFGQSAGGLLTNFHILSKESRKYFRRAIPMSGSVGNYWAISPITDHYRHGFEIAAKLGQPQNTGEGLIAYLQLVEPNKLNKFSHVDDGDRISINFSPVIEKKDALQPFMVDSPEDLYGALNNEVIDTMFTTVSAEMLPLTPMLTRTKLERLIANFSEPLPFREFELLRKQKVYRDLTDEVREFYFGKGVKVSQFFSFLCDLNFYWGIDQSVKSMAAHSNGKTFYAWFSVVSKLNTWTKLKVLYKNMFDLEGAGHGDDLCYLFRCDVAQKIYDEIKSNPTDAQSKISLQTIEYMTKLFTNFAKYGEPSYQEDPVERFLPVQNGQMNYLDITNDGLKMKSNPKQTEMNFWTELKKKTGK